MQASLNNPELAYEFLTSDSLHYSEEEASKTAETAAATTATVVAATAAATTGAAAPAAATAGFGGAPCVSPQVVQRSAVECSYVLFL